MRVVRRFLLKAVRPLDERIFSWSNYADIPSIERLAERRLPIAIRSSPPTERPSRSVRTRRC